MKCAIITVTNNGAKLALKLKSYGINCDIFAKKRRYDEYNLVKIHEFITMKDLIAEIFYKYDALIFFTSTGIAVRMIAPYIIHKAKDPAVIVVDERATFAISLLSGHLGGANEFTQTIAKILNSTAVITTATDINGIIAPDVVASKLGLMPYPFCHIKRINSALVRGKNIYYYIDEDINKADEYIKKLATMGILAKKINIKRLNLSYTPCVVISAKRRLMTNILILSPKRLIVGIGCRKGVEMQLIDKAINNAKQMANCQHMPIKKIVSTTVKANEKGLLAWAKYNNVDICFYENQIMQKMIDKYNLKKSLFVQKQIGIGNVCEASILAYNERAKIILPKTKFEKVTVSLAWE